ncbi:MAG: helix-turn-helix domain protein [Actinomycetia bacterium]|nr:helix-turn-helix domain protein [Actinomycetes bacterium]
MSEVKTSAIAAFAEQLRAWRVHIGWSQTELAEKINYSNSLISGIENQQKTPTADFAAKLDEVFKTPGTFAALQRLIAREALPAYFAPVITYESEATAIHLWELRAVPGLLQTEDYARAVITAGQPRLNPAELDQKVTERINRQQILHRESGQPMLWAVISEGVLRHIVGSRQIMRAQLNRLIDAATLPDVIVQVLPYSAHDHPGTDGPVSVFDFDGKPSVAYTECNGGGMIAESAAPVSALMTTINLIRAAALSPRESLDRLRQIRDEYLDDHMA